MSTSGELIIGVDGGGTKTVALLAPLDDPTNSVVLGRGQAGPGNPRAAGFEVALANIAAAIDAAFIDAGLRPVPAAAACFGLAGAGREAEKRRIIAWASEKRVAQAVCVTGDAEPILAAASPENVGIALICGTGSLAWGRNRTGEVARAGGWGYLMGDEGSAYAIAKAGLMAAVRAADGRGEKTALLDRLLHELSATTPTDFVECVYAPQMTRENLAGLARIVFKLAEDDAVAKAIVSAAADDLAEMVRVVSSRLGLSEGEYPLALAGSVIANQPRLRELLLARLEKRVCHPQSVAVVAEPVRGAVVLAGCLARERNIPGR